MKIKQKKRKTQHFFNQKHYLILRDVENLQERKILQLSAGRIIIYFVLLLLIPILLSVSLGIFIVPHFRDNFSEEAQLRRDIRTLSFATDSLHAALVQHQQYIHTLQAIFAQDMGYLEAVKPPIEHLEQVNQTNPTQSILFLDSASALPDASLELATESLRHLYSPLSGFISDRFSLPDSHYGVDVVAASGSTIHATADGRVLFAMWTEQDGYVIAIQHPRELVSIYKHNSALLKSTGQAVYASEPIAIIGNTGTHSTGTHLHFELWYKSTPVNPSNFIIFY